MIIYTKSDGRENTDISVGRMPPWSVNTGNSVGKFTSITLGENLPTRLSVE